MRFADIKGNSAVCKALAGMVDSGRIPHAIILHEDDGGGAMSIAQAFLQYLFCLDHNGKDSCAECPTCNKVGKMIHPDIHYIFPVSGAPCLSFIKDFRHTILNEQFFTEARLYENLGLENKSALINVAEAKTVMETLSMSALEGGYKAVVIYLPEKMNKEAGNRLLKSIEEPPAHTQFLLVTHSLEQVLPTIVSRCQCIRILPPEKKDLSVPAINKEYSSLSADLFGALCKKDLLACLEVADRISALPSRDSAKAFCSHLSDICRSIFLYQQGMSAFCDNEDTDLKKWAECCKKTFSRGALIALSRSRQMIERNVNIKLIFTDLIDRLYMIF